MRLSAARGPLAFSPSLSLTFEIRVSATRGCDWVNALVAALFIIGNAPRATKSLTCSDLVVTKHETARFHTVERIQPCQLRDAATVSSIIGNARCPSPRVDLLLQFVNNQNLERR